MSGLQALRVDEIVSRGSLRDTDVRLLRQIFYEDGIVSPAEADLVFKLNNACPVQHADWADFFIEAITDYVVFQERPQGYLTSANAHWLIDQIAHDGKVDSKTELELLVNVLDKARWSPVSLVKFALEQVKHAVISGGGPFETARHSLPEGSLKARSTCCAAFSMPSAATATSPLRAMKPTFCSISTKRSPTLSPTRPGPTFS